MEHATALWIAAADKYKIDEKVYAELVHLLRVQDNVAILEMMCDKALITSSLGGGVLYQGVDTDESLMALNREVFPTGNFLAKSPSLLTIGEPNKAFGLAIVHLDPQKQQWFLMNASNCVDRGLVNTTSQASQTSICLDVATKSLVENGILIGLHKGTMELPDNIKEYIQTNVQTFLYTYVAEYDVTIIGGYRVAKPSSVLTLRTVSKLSELLSTFTSVVRVPVATADPRPIKSILWNIRLVPAEPYVAENQVVKSGDSVALKFSNMESALTWVGSVLKENADPAWFRAKARVSERFELNNYLRLRNSGRPLWDITMLSDSTTIKESRDLTKFLNKVETRQKRASLAYPTNSDIERSYWALGPGAKVERGDEQYTVLFSEADIVTHKPPRVTLGRTE